MISGVQLLTRAQTMHPLDPLSAAEISVAVATVRAAGATPEVTPHCVTSWLYVYMNNLI